MKTINLRTGISQQEHQSRKSLAGVPDTEPVPDKARQVWAGQEFKAKNASPRAQSQESQSKKWNLKPGFQGRGSQTKQPSPGTPNHPKPATQAGVWNWREAQTTNAKPGTINQKAKVWYLNSGIGLSKQRNEKLGIQSRDSKTRDKSRGPGPGISTQRSGSRSHNGTD